MYLLSHFKHTCCLIVLLATGLLLNAQTGTASEPVRYVGGVTIDPSVHEGRLRYAIGTESIQVMRANRKHTDIATDSGWTYNHAPDLAYRNDTFFLQYLSNPVDEHIAPGQTLLVTSKDGRVWGTPQIIFPPYKAPAGVTVPAGYDGYMMHQRMGFYVAPNDRLLTLAFYGHAEDPFQEGGIGRVVREIYKDGKLGDIFFIKYESHAQWNERNTSYPFYTSSKDTGFVTACKALLNDRLKTLQWRDEDDDSDTLYAANKYGDHLSAFNYYYRKDGKLVMLWKKSKVALSDDGGKTFAPVKAPTLIMSGGKNWGQKTKDGRYAMCYNPVDNSEYRYPLTVISSDDGIIFDNMLLVQGEVPRRRFYGRWKDFGPCYMRGIIDGNGNPPGNDMWLTYSMNKEDIWISRIQVPVTYKVSIPVNDNFNMLKPGDQIRNWNIYSPRWAPVTVADFPGNGNKSMKLSDEDPYDYARAIRVFKETTGADLRFRIYADQDSNGELSVDVTDQYGNRPVRICLNADKNITITNGSETKTIMQYQSKKWYDFRLVINASLNGNYDVYIDGKQVAAKARLAEAVKSVERISFRTGAYRDTPTRTTPNEIPGPPLPGADEKISTAVYYIDDVRLNGK